MWVAEKVLESPGGRLELLFFEAMRTLDGPCGLVVSSRPAARLLDVRGPPMAMVEVAEGVPAR
jgi:hypothetical protein